ncbi:hypothetical protein GCM10007973_17000 [Polymorphobacter multimanifer]|uniref:Lipoprotein n=1 Tax=Polymorphobacter multimanifer TaxID=1070431 RepID=A0A841L0V1_9SPHN|nr:hypothetical protein [Polymorphobacter multimanifer]MBB6226307.1 hypothetical protein [Polymorphobacter multimanifer]GGI81124.1 hypothetical protein GCM10007973_17000 [Polymorphobacter multimanifer]
MRGLVAMAGVGLLLAGCASPAQRIERKLVEVGVPQGQAQCMGVRLQQRLSTSQLRSLDRLARMNGNRIERMRVEDIARQLAADGDPALVAELLRTGIGCLV